MPPTPLPELALRSQDATWDRARWETLPPDGNRYEVIDGVLYMSTAPSFFHQWIVRQLLLLLHEQVDRAGRGTTIMAPIGVFMPGCDPVQPDLLVVSAADRGIIRGGRIEGVPALLVEVQSPSSVGYDDRVKRQAYARAGVPEYWIVNLVDRQIEIHQDPGPIPGAQYGFGYRTRTIALPRELIATPAPAGSRVAVDDLLP
jgi:Uma2 family endonuclease